MGFFIPRLFIFFSLVILPLVSLGVAVAASAAGPSKGSFIVTVTTSIITVLTITLIMVLERIREGVLAPSVWMELLSFLLLWVLWLASAGSVKNTTSADTALSEVGCCRTCHLYPVVEAFDWMAWVTAFSWFCILLICSINSRSSGYPDVWRSPAMHHPLYITESSHWETRPAHPPAAAAPPPPMSSANPSSEFGCLATARSSVSGMNSSDALNAFAGTAQPALASALHRGASPLMGSRASSPYQQSPAVSPHRMPGAMPGPPPNHPQSRRR